MVDREAYIDLVFRNGLKDYEVLPPSEVWQGIQPIIRKKKTSAMILRAAAAFAVLTVSAAASLLFILNIRQNSGERSAYTDMKGVQEIFSVEGYRKTAPGPSETQYQPVIIADAAVNTTPGYDYGANYSLPVPDLNTSFITYSTERKVSDFRGNRYDIISDSGNPPGKTIEAENMDPVPGDISETFKGERWSLGAMAAPAYYSSINLSNDESLRSLAGYEEAAISYTGGLSMGYKLTKRLSILAGVYYSSVGQRVTGIDTYTGFNAYNNSKGTPQFTVMTSAGLISTGNSDVFLSERISETRITTAYTRDVFDPVKASLEYADNSLLQNFNFLEVPFMMRYKVLDRTVDFNLTGGFSYNILVNNAAYAYSGANRLYVGKTEGLNPVTLSSSLGMGVEYNFSGRFSLNLEPTLRYYITPFGGFAGPSVHPYSFGILSGISYKF